MFRRVSGLEDPLIRYTYLLPAGITFLLLSELPKKVGVAVTELVGSQLLLVVEGKAGEAVQASSSIPGTFVPVKVGQEIWVDGGVLSVVPVRFARASVSIERPCR